jgi:hypothetical protein
MAQSIKLLQKCKQQHTNSGRPLESQTPHPGVTSETRKTLLSWFSIAFAQASGSSSFLRGGGSQLSSNLSVHHLCLEGLFTDRVLGLTCGAAESPGDDNHAGPSSLFETKSKIPF